MTSLHVVCGLSLPQSKILGTPINWRSPEKNFWRLFFRRTLAPVSLASSVPVFGFERFCPRKGCPWPWPRIFFVSLALVSSLVSSTPPLLVIVYPLLRLLWSKSDNKVTRKGILGQYHTGIPLSLTASASVTLVENPLSGDLVRLWSE